MEDALERVQKICDDSGGRSQLFLPRSQGHLNAVRHFYESSSQDARFAVEPGHVDDLVKIMKIISENKDVPFAVKGGGHSSNPGFSSTTGIQISLSRFNKISLSPNKERLTVGAGCVFDEIYRFILPKGLDIVGGGGSVGISGWIMGGGFSLKTSEHGLGIDNLLEAEIVLPKGEKVRASDTTNTALFWAIKGGGNNFGIATEFVLQTHKQGKAYGGVLIFDKSRVFRVKEAIIEFIDRKRPKAAIVAAFRFFRDHGVNEFKFTLLARYGEGKPTNRQDDPFKDFLDIPHDGDLREVGQDEAPSGSGLAPSPAYLDKVLTSLYGPMPANFAISLYNDTMMTAPVYNQNAVVSTQTTSSTEEAIHNAPRPFPPELAGLGINSGRARWGNVMVSTYTAKLIDVVEEEGKAAKRLMEKHKGRVVVADIWPLLPTMVSKSTDSAWPHKDEPNGPLLVYFLWEGSENDAVWIKQMKTALDHILHIAIKENCTKQEAPVYGNTALDHEGYTTVEKIYRNNLNDLRGLRTYYDPEGVMDRAGGFRIPTGRVIPDGCYMIQNSNHITVGADELPGPLGPTTDGTKKFYLCFLEGNLYFFICDKDIYCVLDEAGDRVGCRTSIPSSWKLIPRHRANGKIQYWIQKDLRHWVLRGDQVKLEETGDDDEALSMWTFTPVEPARCYRLDVR